MLSASKWATDSCRKTHRSTSWIVNYWTGSQPGLRSGSIFHDYDPGSQDWVSESCNPTSVYVPLPPRIPISKAKKRVVSLHHHLFYTRFLHHKMLVPVPFLAYLPSVFPVDKTAKKKKRRQTPRLKRRDRKKKIAKMQKKTIKFFLLNETQKKRETKNPPSSFF